MKVSITVENDELMYMHDCLIEHDIPSAGITSALLRKLWDALPESIKLEAVEWGYGS